MASQPDLTGRIRDRILNALHVGSLHPGDRLPSIREVSRDTGTDHRAVAAAYRRLQGEGLVDVRGRSGVYVADQERLGGELLAETAHWLAGVLTDAWRRQIPLADLPELLRRCTVQTHLRAACVESTEDQLTAYTAELRELFGVECLPVRVPTREGRKEDLLRLQQRIREADFVVTTRFHAHAVHRAAQPLGKPVVVLTVNPVIVEAIRRELDAGELVVVATDAEFGERIRAMHAERAEEEGAEIRVILADDRAAVAALGPERTVLLTRAARARLEGVPLPRAIPHSPTISPQAAREISETIIRLNMRAERPHAPRRPVDPP